MANGIKHIPTPPAVRWREFRMRALPVVVFAGAAFWAATLWRGHVAAPTLVAEAETVRVDVAAAQTGTVSELRVGLLGRVAAGEVIARVVVADPETIAASLEVVRAELELLHAGMEPVLQQKRAVFDFEQLRLDWMRERVSLASLRAQIHQAESDVSRLTELRRTNLVSVEEFETALNLRDGLEAQIAEQTGLVDALAPAISDFGADGAESPPRSGTETIRAAIRAQEAKLALVEAELSAAPLTAPIDGVITAIHRRNGETVLAGDPVVTIASADSLRLIGFLRQPLPMEPAPGMAVELRTRGAPRKTAGAVIAEVGHAMEPVPPALLAAVNRAGTLDTGLRLHIPLPAALKVRPGEQVDVIFRP